MPKKCDVCNGAKYVDVRTELGPNSYRMEFAPCKACNETGFAPDEGEEEPGEPDTELEPKP